MIFDVAIIGGGIAGAGVAQAAVAAGYKVVLLEKSTDFGSQTSSSSSKLIHGGLRYLENAQLTLVYSALKERSTLLRLAPDLVKPVPFYFPIYNDSKRSRWQLVLGLSIYRLLAGNTPLARFQALPRRQWQDHSGLNQQQLKGLLQYWDAQTDDQQLTKAVIKSAQQLGALCLSQTSLVSANFSDHFVLETNHLAAENFQIEAQMVINATGPWVNQLADIIAPRAQQCEIEWVQGSHVILSEPAKQGIYYFESVFDQRVIFVMPWQGKTLVGTTEKTLSDLPERITASQEEISYLIDNFKYYFPNDEHELLHSFAGIRVLPKSDESAFNKARETIVWQPMEQNKLITLYGGKLTTFRATAKQVVGLIGQQLGGRNAIADIDEIPLSRAT